MRKIVFIILVLTFVVLAGCSEENQAKSDAEGGDESLDIVTTYSIVYDIVKNVAGEHADVQNLAPIGSDPHQYDPLPEDVQAVTDADAVFYNGLNLEAGNSWFEKMIQTAGKDGEDDPVFRISEGVEPKLLQSGGHKGDEDPHAWLDVQNGIRYAQNARDALIKIDPDNEEAYKNNTAAYIEKLEKLDEKIKQKIAEIPEDKRYLVTSEGAFKYFSAAYDFEAAYIWEINDENEGTPDQIKSVVDLIEEKAVPALFVETSVDPRSMETVSDETGVPIAGEIFTDSLGKPGEEGDTYVEMLEWNADMIVEGLTN
ncbi:metal ABC transporter substrate-binding protein [Lentibacillus salinarum]|uniref:Metal ABC transporter substrate-binding protein n=1 Tax=Lentibacillus salinarum TaxID=446820 RepID=A0ABW3ZWD1_9BACI